MIAPVPLDEHTSLARARPRTSRDSDQNSIIKLASWQVCMQISAWRLVVRIQFACFLLSQPSGSAGSAPAHAAANGVGARPFAPASRHSRPAAQTTLASRAEVEHWVRLSIDQSIHNLNELLGARRSLAARAR